MLHCAAFATKWPSNAAPASPEMTGAVMILTEALQRSIKVKQRVKKYNYQRSETAET